MSEDQFHKGLANVMNALQEALSDRGVNGAVITHNLTDSTPQSANFGITVGARTEMQNFSHEEIEDSGEAIDAPAAVKVRMLVSHFVR